MSDITTTAQEILRLRNRVERLEADVALRNRILGHLGDDTDAETIVAAMKSDLFHAVMDIWKPPETGGEVTQGE